MEYITSIKNTFITVEELTEANTVGVAGGRCRAYTDSELMCHSDSASDQDMSQEDSVHCRNQDDFVSTPCHIETHEASFGMSKDTPTGHHHERFPEVQADVIPGSGKHDIVRLRWHEMSEEPGCLAYWIPSDKDNVNSGSVNPGAAESVETPSEEGSSNQTLEDPPTVTMPDTPLPDPAGTFQNPNLSGLYSTCANPCFGVVLNHGMSDTQPPTMCAPYWQYVPLPVLFDCGVNRIDFEHQAAFAQARDAPYNNDWVTNMKRCHAVQIPRPKQTSRRARRGNGSSSPLGRSRATQGLGRTTVMLRNIPNNIRRQMWLDLLDEEGFRGCYDFVYLPIDFKSGANKGYAFVNLTNSDNAVELYNHFQGFWKWNVPASNKVCTTEWTSPDSQGLQANLELWRNNPVMHREISEEYKPIHFSDGVRVTFPPPTKGLKKPRIGKHPSQN